MIAAPSHEPVRNRNATSARSRRWIAVPSGSWSRPWRLSALLLLLASCFAFGLFFVFIAQTPESSGLWPLVPARIVSIGLVGAIGLTTGSMRVSTSNLGLVAAAGTLDMGANIAFLIASRSELLALVAVITSLYPATTVILARTLLQERMRGRQPFGLALAAVGIALIALG